MPNEIQFNNIYLGHDILRCMPLGKDNPSVLPSVKGPFIVCFKLRRQLPKRFCIWPTHSFSTTIPGYGSFLTTSLCAFESPSPMQCNVYNAAFDFQ